MEKPKHIVLGITGGIAAYKSLFLIRMCRQANWEVKVIATRHALEFVTPLSIETLSQNRLYHDAFAEGFERDVQHISLADWADAVVIAPATANIIGKLANGIADDALSTFLLACKKKVFLSPAMNSNMYEHEAVQANLSLLKQRGVEIIEPDTGFLACGTYGKGRMEEPENIFKTIHAFFASDFRFQGKKVLVTAGPTYEPIDPVRFIGNRSSGLMGFAIAESFVQQGADVMLITGPTSLVAHSIKKRIDVKTAAEMYEAVMAHFENQDIIVMAAAVADYTPKETLPQKMKKKEEVFTLELKKTTDILSELGKKKKENQYLTGFALETENEFENAKNKLQNKNLNLIVLNSMNNSGAGFETFTNQVTLISRKGKVIEFPLKEKWEVAHDIINFIYTELN